MKKILITGASGFFGKSLIQALQNSTSNFECYSIYKKNSLENFDSRFKSFQCDLLNRDEMEEMVSDIKPTHLVHLAWYVSPQKFWAASENLDWLSASINLFSTFCKSGGQVFIGAGTLAEYDISSGILDEKVTPLKPNTLYGQCKKSLHEILCRFRNAHAPQTKIIWPRIGCFFGPGEAEEKLIPKLIHSIKNDIPIDLAEKQFKRPYAHVKYFGEMMFPLLMRDNDKDSTFSMSGGFSYTVEDIVCFMSNVLGKKHPRVHYGKYPSTPLCLDVKTDAMNEITGHTIPDTFYSDLEKVINNA